MPANSILLFIQHAVVDQSPQKNHWHKIKGVGGNVMLHQTQTRKEQISWHPLAVS